MNSMLFQNILKEEVQNDKPICLICSNPNNASHHFGSTTCLACAAFMRRTVVLKMKYKCKKDNNCVIHFTMRMICRSCRYQKCIKSGMKEYLVQKPRSSRIIKKRNKSDDLFDKILSKKSDNIQLKESSSNTESPDDDSSVFSTSTVRKELQQNNVLSSEKIPYYKHNLLSFYIEELRKAQKRRKIIYNDQTTASIFCDAENENTYSINDLKKFDLKELGKNARFDHMLSYEYVMEQKKIFPSLTDDDCNVIFKYAFLGFSCIDSVFVTLWSKSYKKGFLTFTNRNAFSIYDKNLNHDNDLSIPDSLKEKFIYEPIYRFFNQIIIPLSEMNLDIEEFVALKTLTINSLSRCECSPNGREVLNYITNEIIKCLSDHYKKNNITIDRIGEIILFISNFYSIFQMFSENFLTVDSFKLFDIGNEIKETMNFPPNNLHFRKKYYL
ncbi:Nuclear hormone receptor, ligand-binding, core domain and Zinc finger, nuclear hormone receptor-type domain and Nuclear hormone receptor, ligand-binding domain and Zinc finger, NHR/GATA-type domain-containing protein [Strongyloides ratti]|uniref:Uncharacterized protein n=1 Tax=Strongyloides ratti TaxID=34506 RepID=A0A090L534_STRRB|nr:Nuclear hormone receptor, ligand-binding, core domain and Zinc finger, nuclear hormone receptor-type domain and Nuclear hormone receptor, ligand-binding domain and Zinc finger, NHR/GATA-type domain-containing protein [Strongyloides ratti]CEF64832.1 Nuclear hormone receptor, ligand-binding, core domain and Zinc finger, nuclear hormone receptor-type domain and Nuclear hormone receptor, ligand-binding domain and Zinc finger, NHR/GATA-type domain-containing protein [Strongyloides ratti]